MSAMLPLMQAFETQGRFVQSVKHGLSTRGIDAGPPRKPLHPLEQKEKDPIEAMIHKMNKSISQITRQAV
jgi:4-hydroxy-tetrahydrodipicolinate synthase